LGGAPRICYLYVMAAALQIVKLDMATLKAAAEGR
jgi:hypothetical protein